MNQYKQYTNDSKKSISFRTATMGVIAAHVVGVGGMFLWPYVKQPSIHSAPKVTKQMEQEDKKFLEQLNNNAWPTPTPGSTPTLTKTKSPNKPKVETKNQEAVNVIARSTPIPTPKKPSSYTIGSGENLYIISKRVNVSFQELIDYNNIKDVRQLYVGQTIRVP